MDYFLELFGGMSVGDAVIVVGAIAFLIACYQKVEKYFSEKAIYDKTKDEQIQQVIEQAKKYPQWHQQSIDIREQLNESISNLERKLDAVSQVLDDFKKESDETKASSCRYRILRFGDEILHNNEHTKEHFDQILDDITAYEKYCSSHSEYKNDKAVMTIENIKRAYQKHADEGTFL